MVLVVDDNQEICKMLLRVLQISNVPGHCAFGGNEALDWLQQNKPDLVILDVSMPDISGVEVLQRIRANPEWRDIPVILHSALSEQTVTNAANQYGASGTLFKGRYGIKELINLVQSFGVSEASQPADAGA